MATVALSTRIGLADHGRAMTLDEFLDAEEEEGYRYELARGVLEVSLIPGDPHGLLVWLFLGWIRDYERDHPALIFRAGGGADFRLWLPEMVSGRHPDVGVALVATPRDLRGRRRPSLAIEIVSEGDEAHHRDYVTKREEYLAFGLLEYWIVDRFARRVVVLVRDGDVWAEHVFVDGQVASGLVLPGFVVNVADLWAEAEKAGEDHAEDQIEPGHE